MRLCLSTDKYLSNQSFDSDGIFTDQSYSVLCPYQDDSFWSSQLIPDELSQEIDYIHIWSQLQIDGFTMNTKMEKTFV